MVFGVRRRAAAGVVALVAAVTLTALTLTGLAGCASSLQAGPGTDQVVAPSPSPTPVTELGIARVSPRPETYGVGIVVRIFFDHDVPKAARSTVTSLIDVSASKPIGEAGWAWSDARTAVYRPKEFWPAHTTVTITATPTGQVLGTTATGRELHWAGKASGEFRIGAAQLITIDAETDQATVTRDGKTVRTIPVSLGMDGWQTRSGIKVLMEKYRTKRMTSESIGAEEDYTLDVPYAIRLTNSGEFIHAAPWATGRLGRWNGSHGCTNVSEADAEWLYRHHLYGDPVITTGTSRDMEPDNGAGGVWNVSWKTWLSGRV